MNIDKLNGIIPDSVLAQIPDLITTFEVNTPLRLAHFLSQCSHESGGFKRVTENMNYTAERLKVVFPKYFPGTLSESYNRQPEKIGARVYGGRMGNGAEATGDGWKYRGRGYIQLTGKDNYTAFGESINVDVVADPNRVAVDFPLLSAGWFFDINHINNISDDGDDLDTIKRVTKAVNGGLHGIDDRAELFHKFYALLS